MNKMPIIWACELCGKPQKVDPSRSNKNFDVLDMKERCECGGKFKMMLREDAERLRNET